MKSKFLKSHQIGTARNKRSLIPAGTIAKISDIPLKEVISSLGGWPVREPPGWDPGAAPRLEWVLGTLKRNFTLGALVEEWIGPDDRDSSRHIIQVGGSYVHKWLQL